MPSITRFSVRSSGRDLTVVRRPRRQRLLVKATPVIEPEPAKPAEMLKADVVALAESRGIDASGTKADILARLGSVE
jgi:hypothetical protein